MSNGLYKNILSHKQKFILILLLGAWFLVTTLFCIWWLQPKHSSGTVLFLINTVVLFWMYLLPAYFFFFVIRMKRLNPTIRIPSNWKVAMVVTKAPSEPFWLIQRTVLAMLKQEYPHDTWIADEDPTDEIIKWAAQNNVYISTRKGIPAYNQPKWPRREKCKEGNLAYFYDTYGYKKYDFVVQLDADHVPQEHYLEHMLKPFVDEQIGYVSAPSICSRNADTSWAARARLYAEGFLHGAQQAGHTNGFAPLCFGSHYAVRTKALNEIGGLGPELAEDHSTTLIMNAYGWRGAHALDAIAIGDGPDTFADAMTQEFQWARSLMNVLLTWTPQYIKQLSWKIKLQFLFSQLWYVLFSIVMLIGVLIPIIAIIANTPLATVSYLSFVLFNITHISITLSVMFFLKRLRLLRPIDAKLISWEVIFFQLARWPWTLMGIISAIFDRIRNQEFKFKVTPKDKTGYTPLPFKMIVPYFMIILLYFMSATIWNHADRALGYYYFIISGLFMYLATCTAIIILHAYENKH